jgi:hypothetical protein
LITNHLSRQEFHHLCRNLFHFCQMALQISNAASSPIMQSIQSSYF